MTIKPISRLIESAVAVQKNAYAPYSNFHVGAAILTQEGHSYVGCNVENSAYPLGQCAEASAIGNMIASGKDKMIEHVVIASPNDNTCPPCGGCRQKLFEFSHPDTQVHLVTSSGRVTTHTMSELLPEAFNTTLVK